MRILVIFTCFNRKEKTKECIQTLMNSNKNCNFSFVIVDDGSSDGTWEMLQNMKETTSMFLLKGNGKLFYSGRHEVRNGICFE